MTGWIPENQESQWFEPPLDLVSIYTSVPVWMLSIPTEV
jgi:hypothetical protein